VLGLSSQGGRDSARTSTAALVITYAHLPAPISTGASAFTALRGWVLPDLHRPRWSVESRPSWELRPWWFDSVWLRCSVPVARGFVIGAVPARCLHPGGSLPALHVCAVPVLGLCLVRFLALPPPCLRLGVADHCASDSL